MRQLEFDFAEDDVLSKKLEITDDVKKRLTELMAMIIIDKIVLRGETADENQSNQ